MILQRTAGWSGVVTIVAVVVVGVCTMAGYLGQYSQAFELCSHFRLLYAVALCLACVVLAFNRRWRMLVLAAMFFSINAMEIMWFYVPAARAASGERAGHLRMVQLNVWGGKNRHYKEALAELREANADVIMVSEVTESWYRFVKVGLADYPFSTVETKYGGVAFFSRLPAKEMQIEYCGTIRRPSVKARVDVGGRAVTVIFAHTVPPTLPSSRYRDRNAELSELAAEARRAVGPVVVAGDLNCTPWSYYFHKLERDGGLVDTEPGFGFQPTWSTFWHVPCFPIDHYLVSQDLTAVKRYVGHKVGSDHLPVVLEVEVGAGGRVSE